MEGKGMIYEAIAAVMADVGAVGKTSKNTQQGFMFRGIDAVMNALNPAMVKHRIFVVPEILEQTREERQSSRGAALIYSICKIKYTFYADDGSSVSAVVIGEGMDSGDKATNKAMSIAFRYACFQVFCIPTEEMRDADPDRESPEVADTPKAAQKQSRQTAAEAQRTQAPMTNFATRMATKQEQQSLIHECARTGFDINQLFKQHKVQTIDQLTQKQVGYYIAELSTKPQNAYRKEAPKQEEKQNYNPGFQSATPEGADEGLPWN